MIYFVILGKKGKIAKSLSHNLSLSSKKVINLEWAFIKKALLSKIILKDHLYSEFGIVESENKFIVINCLKQTFDQNKNLELNKYFNSNFKLFSNKVTYIFLSTFEPNKFPLTRYRKTKKLMEEIIKRNKNYIVRIGFYIKKTNSKINNKHILIANSKNQLILVPVTLEDDLSKFIIETSFLDSKNYLLRCYSNFYALEIRNYFPFLNLINYDSVNKHNIIKLPLSLFSKISKFISKLLILIGIKNNIIDLLEKVISIFLQQKIIYNSKNKKNDFLIKERI